MWRNTNSRGGVLIIDINFIYTLIMRNVREQKIITRFKPYRGHR